MKKPKTYRYPTFCPDCGKQSGIMETYEEINPCPYAQCYACFLKEEDEKYKKHGNP